MLIECYYAYFMQHGIKYDTVFPIRARGLDSIMLKNFANSKLNISESYQIYKAQEVTEIPTQQLEMLSLWNY